MSDLLWVTIEGGSYVKNLTVLVNIFNYNFKTNAHWDFTISKSMDFTSSAINYVSWKI